MRRVLLNLSDGRYLWPWPSAQSIPTILGAEREAHTNRGQPESTALDGPEIAERLCSHLPVRSQTANAIVDRHLPHHFADVAVVHAAAELLCTAESKFMAAAERTPRKCKFPEGALLSLFEQPMYLETARKCPYVHSCWFWKSRRRLEISPDGESLLALLAPSFVHATLCLASKAGPQGYHGRSRPPRALHLGGLGAGFIKVSHCPPPVEQ